MSVIHLKKKDVVKSKVRGVEIEFDHEKLATILGVPGTNGICEYIKDVWEESKYTKPLEIIRRFANDENLMAARRVKIPEAVMTKLQAEFERKRANRFLADLEKWENLFKRRELVHIDAIKEFYAKISVIHLKKKDVVKSKVRGVEIEFDHEKLATILGVPRTNGICEYIKDVWEESKYTKPLEITRRSANDENLMAARRVKENGVWWIGSGENRRRDDEVEAPEEEAEEEEEGNKAEFDWKAVIDEATIEGESGSDDQFYDAQVEVEEPVTETPAATTHGSAQQKEQESSGVDPSCPTGRIPEAVMTKLQAEFERKRANRFLADLEKAKAENARLLALLHQAQSKPNP
ncbi:hypothetical protein Dimus_029453 [Dionaea muscipula]